GFAGAVNAGIRASETPFVALLNSDTALDPHWLEALVDALDELPDYDVAASRMLIYSDPSILNAAGDVYDLWAVSGRNRGVGRPASEFERRERVLGACAGAALYRRAFFEDVGLFDERFFLMSEDTDVNLRALIAGKKCVYVPEAKVRHKVSASIEAHPGDTMDALAMRNLGLVVAKDLPWFLIVCVAAPAYLWRLFRSTVPVRPAKWHLIPRLLREMPARHATFMEGWRLGRQERSDVWSRRVASRTEIFRWLLKGYGPLR
ncbi:MAG: glycosyltransferase family 2 protein, partial [Coriobacteriia bacterium]|nr:glycosyltransferase family 2 protein [Coriobacteriia bacterium]